MGSLSLLDVSLYKVLSQRNSNNAKMYSGLLLPIAGDADELLKFIKKEFPLFPDHGIQHSFRILNYLSSVLHCTMQEGLSDTELFCLIMAALFHDTGMALFDTENADILRERHNEFSIIILEKYFNEQLKLLTNSSRLLPVISFVCYSHGITLTELCSDPHFSKQDKIDFDIVRYSLLSFLLRIGDLLDLEEGRVNKFVLSNFCSRYTETALNHNVRHTLVQIYDYSPNTLNIEVMAENIDQYKIWTTWFEYLKNDILNANTHLQNYSIHFPLPNTKINKPKDACYDVEELRFEIDDKGGIWNILSQSIYTDEFDFLRELIQNAIDATLLKLYLNSNIPILTSSPRSWNTDVNCEDIIVGYSQKRKLLLCIDQGIGMNKIDLKKFLFKVTGSGYADLDKRNFPFPSIAKFGIGFVSCLVNANSIEVYTKKQEDRLAYRVSLSADSNLAVIQELDLRQIMGTAIRLDLKYSFTYSALISYIERTFIYPSMCINCVDIDKLESTKEYIMPLIDIDDALKSTYRFTYIVNKIEAQRIKLDSTFVQKLNPLIDLRIQIENLVDWISDNIELNILNSDKTKLRTYWKKIKQLNTKISDVSGEDYTFIFNAQSIDEKVLFNTPNIYIDQFKQLRDEVEKIGQIEQQRKPYKTSCTRVLTEPVSIKFEWKYCVVLINDELDICDIKYFHDITDFTWEKGIIFINHEDANFEIGLEFKSISGFIFNKGKICKSIVKFNKYSHARRHSETKSIIIGSVKQLDYYDELEAAYYAAIDDPESEDTYWTSEIESKYEVVYINQNRILYSNDISIPEIENATVNTRSKIIESIISEAPSYFESAVSIINNFTEDIKDIERIISEESSVYCQDGIRIPLNLVSLFPIGFFKITCNCTAESRMALNVTRHKSSENRIDINNWMRTTGAYIQNSLIDNITNLFRKLALDVEINELIEIGTSSDYFTESAVNQLKQICQKNSLW